MFRIEIENHPLLPVRLVPFVTGWKFSPDIVAKILSGRDKFHCVDISSFFLSPDGKYHPMLNKEWDTVVADLNALSEKLKASENTHNDNYPIWRREAIKILPASVFVWLDDLEIAWNIAFSEENMVLLDERPGDRNLNLAPRIPSDVSGIIFKGFETLLSTSNSLNEANLSEGQTEAAELREHSQATQAEADQTAKAQNRFVLTGDHWSITYQGETKTFNNTKGLRYIAWLIQNQGKDILVSDLYYAVNPPDREHTDSTFSSMTTEQFEEIGLSLGDLGDAGVVITPEGKKRIEQTIGNIRDQIKEAIALGDEAKQAELEAMEESMLDYLATGFGLGGKPRKASSPIERVRSSVTQRIKSDIKYKIKLALPELGRHLDIFLKTGTRCIYKPHPSVDWIFDAD